MSPFVLGPGQSCHPAPPCHPERSEGPLHLAWSEALPANCIGPSRKERAQDDKRIFADVAESGVAE